MRNFLNKIVQFLHEKLNQTSKTNSVETFRKSIITDFEVEENFEPNQKQIFDESISNGVDSIDDEESVYVRSTISNKLVKRNTLLDKAQEHIKNSYLFNKDESSNQTKQTVQDLSNVYFSDTLVEDVNTAPLGLASDTQLALEWDCNPNLSLTPSSALSSLIRSSTSQSKLKSSKISQSKIIETQEIIPESTSANALTDGNRASHPYRHFSQEALEKLGQNLSTPPSTLEWLANHGNTAIKVAVAKNPNCPINIINLLTRDQDPLVRLSIAERVNNAPETLQVLLNDPNYLVAWQAQEALNKLKSVPKSALPKVLKNTYPINTNLSPGNSFNPTINEVNAKNNLTEAEVSNLVFVASNKNSAQTDLMELTNYPYRSIHLALSRNENIPISTFWFLAKLGDLQIKRFLLSNPGCPLEILKFLKDDEDVIIAKQANSVLTSIFGKQ